ncbi:MAG: phage holin family protein [Pseudomonadota bacterium]
MTARNQSESTETESLLEQVQALQNEVRGVVKAQLQLAGMETRRAGESFVRMVALGVIAACLVFSAWAVLLSVAIIAVVSSGILSLTSALIIIALAHLALAFYIVRYIKRRSRDLLFSETSRSF